VTLLAACSRLASVAEFRASNCAKECDCSTRPTADVEAWLDDASDLVYYLTGGAIFGECEGSLRPCRSCWCCRCRGCCDIDKIPLRPDWLSVTSIKIDGSDLDPATYAVTRRGELYRVATGARPDPWPSCQDLWRPTTEPNTFEITYRFGQASQPYWVRNAVLELACDAARWEATHLSALPATTTFVVYQGMSATMQDRAEAIAQAGSALPAIAQLLAMTNRGNSIGFYSPQPSGAWTFPLS
jgi:hypothetical protein